MPKRIIIKLEESTRKRLERRSKNAKQPYQRDRAQAILLVADGMPIYQVVEHLYHRVHRNAVSEWVQRFLAEGIAGLEIRKGRGRKSAFSPPQPPAGPGQVDLPPASVTAKLSDCS
jgi:transposase